MRYQRVASLVFVALTAFFHLEAPSLGQTDGVPVAAKDKADTGKAATDNKAALSRKELVVLSAAPEFYGYTLSTVAILLTVITILVGAITGIGLTLVIRGSKERQKFEEVRRKYEDAYEATCAKLDTTYREMIEVMKRTAFGLGSVANAKAEIRQLLADNCADVDAMYNAVYKTVRFADAECIRLYGRVLSKFGKDLDIVRIVRTALVQYSGDAASMVSGNEHALAKQTDLATKATSR